MENDELKKYLLNGRACDYTVACGLHNMGVLPITYYSYVVIGELDFQTGQCIKTKDALPRSFIKPAMTDMEAWLILSELHIYLERVKKKSRFIRVFIPEQDRELEYQLPRQVNHINHPVYAVSKLILNGHIEAYQVNNILSQLKSQLQSKLNVA